MHSEFFVFNVFNREIIMMSYSFFYGLAVVFVVVTSYFNIRQYNFTNKQIVYLFVPIILGGFVGARFLHFVFNYSLYLEGELDFFDLHMRGFTIIGGLIFAMLTGFGMGKVYKVNMWKFGDVTIPFVAFGIGIARIGCFLNGCCFGHVTNMPWGVKFPILSFAHQYQITNGLSNIFIVLKVHPAQLYELVYVVVGGVIVILINRKRIFDGAGILFFGVWFSLFRLMNMYFRVLPDSLKISIFQYSLLYVFIFLVCSGLILWKIKCKIKV